MNTLDDIKQKMERQSSGTSLSYPASMAEQGKTPYDLPFWIVVVNPRRQPPQPKFHSGHETQESADTLRDKLQATADEDAAKENRRRKQHPINIREQLKRSHPNFTETQIEDVLKELAPPREDYEAYQFFTIDRPEGGKL